MKFFLTENDSLAETIANITPSDEVVHVILADGEHKGLEHERIFYNLPNPFVIESESENAKKCLLRAENCEAFHKDTENRAVLTFGENCTSITLKNFTIENTHVFSFLISYLERTTDYAHLSVFFSLRVFL